MIAQINEIETEKSNKQKKTNIINELKSWFFQRISRRGKLIVIIKNTTNKKSKEKNHNRVIERNKAISQWIQHKPRRLLVTT